MGRSDNTIVLAGDIGGTKTRLGVFVPGKTRPLLKRLETFPSREASGVEEMVERFLDRHPAPISRACFGIAGPVVKGRVKTTNLPWEVCAARIKTHFRWASVRLINDLAATALGVLLLTRREVFPLNTRRQVRGENLGLLAPGTGLGMALLVWTDHGYLPVSSEGGHGDFCPNNEEEWALREFLGKRFGHVSLERVLSGPGLFNIYQWLRDSGRYREPAWLADRIAGEDPPKAVSDAALKRGTPLALGAVKQFVSILGAAAGNLALTGMTTGGIYLAGGIPPRILPLLQTGSFKEAFVSKGRFRSFLEKIPVHVILDDRAALLGAAACALSG